MHYEILCDADGKILLFKENKKTFNHPNIFKKRIFNFFHHDCILIFINKFNDIINKKYKEYNGNFLCIREDSSFFYAKVSIKKGIDHNKLNIIIIESKYKDLKSQEKNSFLNKLNVIIRGKYLFGSIIPYIFSVIWSLKNFDKYFFYMLIASFICMLFFHISANTFNDYFDWVSGRDKLNENYILFNTGGSRAIEFNFISEKKLLFLSIFCFMITLICGLYITYIRGQIIFFIGIFSAFSIFFYSAPPIHFASKYGLGELLHALCLGPLFVYGCVFALTGNAGITEILVGFPFGLLITGCLLTNECPDSESDNKSKKINLSVLLGLKKLPYLYFLLILLSFLFILLSITINFISTFFLSIILLLPYAIKCVSVVFKINKGRFFIIKSCIISFKIYLFFSLFLIFSRILEYIII